ncbi:MAG: divalent metal cation transporter [Actinomycetota bacterium]|jgi:Mn2+/Fe2+ NRAMP family transporter|nr:divalent metal cation transporter [Actinomycetota bacterium]
MQAGLRSTLIGAMFLMATSAIGPGFITQTTTFTVQLGAAFAFAIAVSIVVDIALQMNVWRIIGVTGYRAQELGNRVLPGLGFLMAFLLLVGGFVFNVGNVSGAGLGIQAMLGVDPKIGGAVSALIAIGLFLSKRAGVAIDRAVVVLGVVMITLTTFVAIVSGPPVGAVLRNVVLPEQVSALAITTLIGGTVGGYIVYAGAHRLLDSGVSGRDNVQTITQASIIGILITGLMRILLFLAILGVVTMGAQLDPESLAASAFQVAAGEVGLRVFGIVLWAAAITSVIGASYTTVTFITPRTAGGERLRPWLVAGFIVITSVIYLLLGTAPQTLLVFAGAFNGILLPVGIGVILFVGWFRGDLMGGYRYPKWLLVLGTLAWLATLYFAVNAISPAIELFTGG